MIIDFQLFEEPMKRIMSNIYPYIKKTTIDSYKNIVVNCKKDVIELYASSEFRVMRYRIKAPINEELNFAIDIKKFNSVVNTVKDANVKVTDKNVIIKYKNKRIKIARAELDLLSISRQVFQCVDYDYINFKEGMDYIKDFIANDKFNNILNNAYFIVDEDKLKCVGTDGSVMAYYTYDNGVKFPESGVAILPFDFDDDKYLFTTCSSDNGDVVYNLFSRKTDLFEEEIYIRTSSGQYPNFKKIINFDGEEKSFKINKNELNEFINTSQKILGNGLSFFLLNIEDNNIIISAYDTFNPDDKYEQKINDFEENFGNCKIGFNLQYIHNMLKNINGDYFSLKTFGENQPYYNLQNNLLQLIMPMVLNYM